MSRVNIQKIQPQAYNAMFGLENYLLGSTIAKDLQEIIRIRASLINQCHFCIEMHTKEALKLGLSKDKIQAISSWHGSDTFNNTFSNKECAVLLMTDVMTNVKEQGVPDEVYDGISQFFTEIEIAQVIMIIATINAWNRIGLAMSDD